MCSVKQRLFFSPNHAARVSAQGSELEPWPTHKTYCAVDVVSSQIWKRQLLTEIKLMSAGQQKQQEKPSHRAVDVVFSQDLEAAAARPHHQRSAAVDPAGGMGGAGADGQGCYQCLDCSASTAEGVSHRAHGQHSVGSIILLPQSEGCKPQPACHDLNLPVQRGPIVAGKPLVVLCCVEGHK